LCCQIIQDRFDNDEPLNTSWEISIVDSEKKAINGKLVKVINDGVFIGHALLSKYTSPAYDCSGMLEVAEEQENDDFAKALFEDLSKINEICSEENIKQAEDDIETQQETIQIDIHTENISVENKLNNDIEEKGGVVDMAENKIKTEVSSVTTNDLYNKLNVAINAIDTNRWICISRVYPYEFRAVGYDWYAESDDDYIEFKYVVNSDESISIVSETPVKMTFVPSTQIDEQMKLMQTQMDEMNDEFQKRKPNYLLN
jgi:ribosomal protein L31E